MKKIELVRYMELIGNVNQAKEKRYATVNAKNNITEMLRQMEFTLTGMYDLKPLLEDEFFKSMGDQAVRELQEVNKALTDMRLKLDTLSEKAFKALDDFEYANDLEARKLRKQLAEKLEG